MTESGITFYLWLLVAVFAGWLLAQVTKKSARSNRRSTSDIYHDYFVGLNYLLRDEPDGKVLVKRDLIPTRPEQREEQKDRTHGGSPRCQGAWTTLVTVQVSRSMACRNRPQAALGKVRVNSAVPAASAVAPPSTRGRRMSIDVPAHGPVSSVELPSRGERKK